MPEDTLFSPSEEQIATYKALIASIKGVTDYPKPDTSYPTIDGVWRKLEAEAKRKHVGTSLRDGLDKNPRSAITDFIRRLDRTEESGNTRSQTLDEEIDKWQQTVLSDTDGHSGFGPPRG